MGIAELLQKGKCRVGLHRGEWGYVTDGSCVRERNCPHCGARSEKTVHLWQDWAYDDPASCALVRSCGRCDEREMRTEHQWAPPSYDADGACTQTRVCSRCSEREPAGIAHAWDRWSYEDDESCVQRLSCSRCDSSAVDRRVAHDWGAWEPSAFYQSSVCTCRHCGELVLDVDGSGDVESAISFQATHRALWQLMESHDAAAVRQRLETDAALLLSPAASRCLEFSVEQLVDTDSERATLRQLGALLERCRLEGIDTVFRAPDEPEPEAPPPVAEAPTASGLAVELCGDWRSMEILGAGSGMSMTTETRLLLAPDGRFGWASTRNEAEGGRWTSTGGVISLSFDDGTERSWAFRRDGDVMIFPNDQRYRLWNRIR